MEFRCGVNGRGWFGFKCGEGVGDDGANEGGGDVGWRGGGGGFKVRGA